MTITTTDAAPAVSIRNLQKNYGNLRVLRGISLDAQNGDVISILGSSGSGKSTLLRCINMLEAPSTGEIHIAGEKIFMKDRQGTMVVADPKQINRLRSSVAMVFQNFHLWSHKTILQNVCEAPIYVQKRPRRECIEEAEAFLARVGIFDKRDAYPAHLSGGQQQRAAIARALAIKPKVMLFDEPTSALDPERVGEVLQVMRSLAEEGRTMLVVTHEMGFARDVSDRIVFLHRGEVELDDPPSEAFSHPRSERFRQFITG